MIEQKIIELQAARTLVRKAEQQLEQVLLEGGWKKYNGYGYEEVPTTWEVWIHPEYTLLFEQNPTEFPEQVPEKYFIHI